MSVRKTAQLAKLILALLLIATAGGVLYYKHTHPHIIDDARLTAWRRLTAPKPAQISPWVFDQSPDSQHPPTPLPEAPLARLARLAAPPQPLALSELAQAFPEFHHKPFRTSGFDPLVLPFRYEDPQNLGDRAEANAFSFLLADALDWAPGNYCGRHPYFVFKRESKGMQYLTTTYNADFIGKEVRYWSTTHGVGGVLRRTTDGLAGTLEIYDALGANVFRKDYPPTNDYFALLGDMSVDAMNFFGEPPSDALAKFLHAPRCQHVESIIRLGMAAFAEQYSDDEWKLYDRILADDPDFAEVRYWEANQKNWADQITESERQRQIALALKSRVTVSALETFSPSSCPDPRLAGMLPTWEKQAAHLSGDDSPVLLICRLNRAERYHRTDPDLVRRALQVAAVYPNNQFLVEQIVRVISAGYAGKLDAESAASLCIASWADRYSNGTLSHRNARQLLVEDLADLGLYDLACPVADQLIPTNDAWDLDTTCSTELQAGHFAKVIQIVLGQQHMPDEENGQAVMDAAVAATAINNPDSLQQLRQKFPYVFAGHEMETFLSACHDAAAGKTFDSFHLRNAYIVHSIEPGATARLILASQADILLSRRHMRDLIWQMACYSPNERLYWALLDGYQRQQPTTETPAFYRSLAWLYPDDRWVSAAMADWRARQPQAAAASPTASPQAFLDAVNQFPAINWPTPSSDPSLREQAAFDLFKVAPPWVAADAIHTLLSQGQTRQAQDLALRYQDLVVQTGYTGIRAFAARLVRITKTDPDQEM